MQIYVHLPVISVPAVREIRHNVCILLGRLDSVEVVLACLDNEGAALGPLRY